jgi:hypothetical protein
MDTWMRGKLLDIEKLEIFSATVMLRNFFISRGAGLFEADWTP